MPFIDVIVRNRTASHTGKSFYVCGNGDFLVRFDFDSEWDASDVKTARFVDERGAYTDVVFSGSDCPVPVMTGTRVVNVGVFSGDLKTTTPARILAAKSILCDGGVPADPAPGVYAQIIELLNKISDKGVVTEEQVREAIEKYLQENPIEGVTPEQVQEAVNVALQEAKDSGEFDGPAGPAGEAGFSPIANVHQTTSGVKITITDQTGTTTASVSNGKDGKDGISPAVTTSKSGKVTTITIKDASGTKTATINDGADGNPGEKGDKGDKGDTGPAGPQGPAGADGEKGEKGDKGDTGPAGPAGADGAKGDKGDTGETGATGPKGEQGPKGDKGDTGPAGPTGAKGDPGLVWCGEWDEDTTYSTGDAVSYNGSAYIAVLRSIPEGYSPDDDTDSWSLLAAAGANGTDGTDGVSPTITTSKSGKVTTLTIKDASGTKTATINDGADGTSVTVQSVTESTDDGGSNVVTFSDGKTLTVKNGSKGSAGEDGQDGKSAYQYAQDGGYTGTEEEFAAKLAGEGGSTVLPVTKAEYSAMTEAEIAQHYANGVRLLIVEDGYTNLVPKSTDADGNVYRGCGYWNGYRLTGNGGVVEANSVCISGFMPYTHGAIIRIVGSCGDVLSNGGEYVGVYDANHNVIQIQFPSALVNSGAATWAPRADGLWELTIDTSKVPAWSDAQYFRASCVMCVGADMVVTINEPIGLEV